MGAMDISQILGLDASKVGPRGGDPINTPHNVQARIAPLNQNAQGMHRGPGKGGVARDRSEGTYNGIVNEAPWHTMAAYMLLAGRTNSEIAAAAGVGANHVSVLKAQRWFQEKLAILSNNEGEDILGLIKSETAASVAKLVELRDNAENERTQLTAANILLEQAVGKATQKIVSAVSHSVHKNPTDEMTAIQDELAALRRNNPTVSSK